MPARPLPKRPRIASTITEQSLSPANEDSVAANVRAALAEDVGAGDKTAALVPASQSASATVRLREPAVICGQPWFNSVYRHLDEQVSIDWLVTEGGNAEANDSICRVHGNARSVLTGERAALNFLQTLSATATLTRRYVDAVADTGTIILDTRKTIPGLRLAQKYAVRRGGAENHRLGLFDAVLIKENHIAAAGSIANAVRAADSSGVLVEIEVENLVQLREALTTSTDRILLDNFSLGELRHAVEMREESSSRAGLEASGGVTLDTVRDIAETGVDYISVGALTKDLRAIDFSMRFSFDHEPDNES